MSDTWLLEFIEMLILVELLLTSAIIRASPFPLPIHDALSHELIVIVEASIEI